MRMKVTMLVATAAMFTLATACAGTGEAGAGGNLNILTQEEIASANVSTLYEAVQRLRPRWLEVRSMRTMGMETEIGVVMNRTFLGGVDELRSMGTEVALTLQYVDGARAAAEFRLPGDRHIEGVIWVRTSDFMQ